MRQVVVEGDVRKRVAQALARSPLFAGLSPDVLENVAARGDLLSLELGELLMQQGAVADCFFVVLSGELDVLVHHGDEVVEVSRLLPPDTVGEMGLLLQEPRSASVRARAPSVVQRFSAETFAMMYERVPGFGLSVAKALARRVAKSSHTLGVPDEVDPPDDPEVTSLVPVELMQRHRVVPLRQLEHRVVLGFVDDPRPQTLNAVRALLPGMEVLVERITIDTFERVLRTHSGVRLSTTAVADGPSEGESARVAALSPRLDALLRRTVAEGASDLHLSAQQRPRWRIDGEVLELSDAARLGESEVLDLLAPVMDARAQRAFREDNDVDFAHAVPGVARFRINLFRDKGGVSAVLRQIPARILTFEQLQLPPVIERMCEQPKGLVLVTGPTGSGKSTTLAAMIDFINKARRAHIITLEDPIEFVHTSQLSLVNQREVGAHTQSFQRALRAALREDPDIVLVGELRDKETIALALETASTGHLVFGTLHTGTAMSTVDRIVDVFAPEQQAQVRSVLADTLRGVVAQTLCRRIGGGRVAALETLVVSFAIANLIREGKNHQIASAMATAKAQGNALLNEALAQLVNGGVVDFNEAYSKAIDKPDLQRRCGRPATSEMLDAEPQRQRRPAPG